MEEKRVIARTLVLGTLMVLLLVLVGVITVSNSLPQSPATAVVAGVIFWGGALGLCFLMRHVVKAQRMKEKGGREEADAHRGAFP